MLHTADNEGSNKECCAMGKGSCPYPCRMCECPKSRLFDCNVDDIPLRDDDFVRDMLAGAWGAFCKSMQREADTGRAVRLTAWEQHVLKECARLSIHPIMPALMMLEKPYPEYK